MTISNHADSQQQHPPPLQQEQDQKYRALIGRFRFQNDTRQLGAVLLVLGMGTTFSTFVLVAYIVEGRTGSNQIQGFRLPVLVANLLQVLSGMVAMVTGVISPSFNKDNDSPSSSWFPIWSKWMVVIVN